MWKSALFSSLLVVTTAALAGDPKSSDSCEPAPGATGKEAAPDAKVVVKVVTVDEVMALIEKQKADKTPLTVFDVNSAKTRKTKGVLPGAVLLSGTDYDVAVLPKDKAQALVFYCASEKCGASPTAAKRALKAGYTNVMQMKAGIAGWVKAKKPVERPNG